MTVPRNIQMIINKHPPEIKQILFTLRERIDNLKKKYGSLQRLGKPPIETIEELAVIYYLLKNDLTTRQLAKILGIQHITIWRWKQTVENKQEFIIAGEKVEVDPDQLIKLVKEMIQPKSRKWLKDVRESAVIQEFLANPVKRQKSSKHGMFYTRTQVNETLKIVNDLALFIKQYKDTIRIQLKEEPSNNPDLWSEDFLRKVIDLYCASRTKDSFKILRCKRRIKLYLRRIPRWRDFFQGEIGSVKQVIRPKESTMFLEHYYQLKKLAQQTDDNSLKALYLIVGLHLWTGAREGYGSLRNKLERLETQGIKTKYKGLGDIDLDDEIVDSSLIGIKWKNAKFDQKGNIVGFDIYEEKTKKAWTLSMQWLDQDISKLLREVYEQTARKRGINSVIKSILVHYKVRPPKGDKWSVEAFRKWYQKKIREMSELLQLPWRLTPHRIRSGHIAILAELRIPMEMALSNIGFGVGWEDVSTAIIFYMRFSQRLLQDYIRQAEEIKQQIAQEIY